MDQSLLTVPDLSILHDAELCLVAMDREAGTLRLGFKGSDHTTYAMSFHGVLTYRINDVIYQNVVSRVVMWGSDQPIDGEMERVMRWTSCSGSTLLISEQVLERYVAKVRSGELRLVYVDPSWGAEIGVLAERMHLSAEQE